MSNRLQWDYLKNVKIRSNAHQIGLAWLLPNKSGFLMMWQGRDQSNYISDKRQPMRVVMEWRLAAITTRKDEHISGVGGVWRENDDSWNARNWHWRQWRARRDIWKIMNGNSLANLWIASRMKGEWAYSWRVHLGPNILGEKGWSHCTQTSV